MLSKKELFKLLSKRFENDECKKLCDLPLPATLHGAVKGAKRIKEAIDAGWEIAIVGDYDVDGVVSTLLVDEFLQSCGVKATIKLPNRFKDGYGLNENIVKDLAAKNIKLIITVDNGILALEAAKRAKELGICLIISDHHNPGKELPDAYAVINPKQENCSFVSTEICGAQVAWYLLAALKKELKVSFDLGSFLDLLCVAIVADMMELKGINRLLVQRGLSLLNSSKRPCFVALKRYYEKQSFNYEDLGFIIAPLINCAGRMEDASLAYEFLQAKDLELAFLKLEVLQGLNAKRKATENEILSLALKEVDANMPFVLVAAKNLHEGVLGIVASRLSKLYNKPSFVLSIDAEVAKGSARSVGEINILELLEDSAKLLQSFGGHKGAAGLSLDEKNLKAFKEGLAASLKGVSLPQNASDISCLGELYPREIDWGLMDLIELFEPFGQANAKPSFYFTGYVLKKFIFMGKDKVHVKLDLEKEGLNFTGIFFNCTRSFEKNERLSFFATLSKNTFKGKSTIQLLIQKVI